MQRNDNFLNALLKYTYLAFADFVAHIFANCNKINYVYKDYRRS